MSVSRGVSRYRDPSRFLSPVAVPFDEAISVRARFSPDSIQSKTQYTQNYSPQNTSPILNDRRSCHLPSARVRDATSWKANKGFLEFVGSPCARNTTESLLTHDLQKTDSLRSLEDFLSVADNNPYTFIQDRREDDHCVSHPVAERDQLAESLGGIAVTASSSSDDVFAGITAAADEIETSISSTMPRRALNVDSSWNKDLPKTKSNPSTLSSGLPTARLSNVKHPKGHDQVSCSPEFEAENEIVTHRGFEDFGARDAIIVKNKSESDAQTLDQSNVELTLEDFEKIMDVTTSNNRPMISLSKSSSVSPSAKSSSSKSFVSKPLRILKKSWSKLRFGYRRKKRIEATNSKQSQQQPCFEHQVKSESSLKGEPADSIDTLPTVSTKNSTVSAHAMSAKGGSMVSGKKSHRHRISVTKASQSFASETSEPNAAPLKTVRPLKGYIDDCSIVFSKSEFSSSSGYSDSFSYCSSDYSDDLEDFQMYENPSKAVAQTASELLNPGSLRVLQEEFVAMFGQSALKSKRRR